MDGRFQRAVAVVDDPALFRSCVADVAKRVVFAEKRRVIVVVQGRAIEPKERFTRAVEGIGEAHRAEVPVFATRLEDVARHIGVVAGRAVEIDRRVKGGFERVFCNAEFSMHHIGLNEFVAPGVVADAPAPGEQGFEFVGVHVAIAVVAGIAQVAHLAQLPDHHLDMAGDAAFLVDGNGEAVQVREGFVVCDGIDPGFVVFPRADCECHVFLPFKRYWKSRG